MMVWQECNEVSWRALGNLWFTEREGTQTAGGMEKNTHSEQHISKLELSYSQM